MTGRVFLCTRASRGRVEDGANFELCAGDARRLRGRERLVFGFLVQAYGGGNAATLWRAFGPPFEPS